MIDNEIIYDEAKIILHERGLHGVLEKYGRVHVVGSYTLRLMTWRDLDIFVESEEKGSQQMFKLGQEAHQAVNGYKSFLTDYSHGEPEFGFSGYYWGIRTRDVGNEWWKIDIHVEGNVRCMKQLEAQRTIESKLNDGNRAIILAIKEQAASWPEYRKSITSIDIYNAVLDHGVLNITGFKQYLGMAKA